MRLIDADKLKEFVATHDYMLRDAYNSSDKGMFTCGIFQAINEQPSVQPEEPEVIRCKDCKWWDDGDGVSRVCHAAKHGYMSSHWDISIYRTYKGDFYCADAERR